ncbi:MAG: hypothetical protein M0R76_06880 [Proteobacteria bacterium]|nr:hypothetical protein [Pseudomonadota bacterium]
MSHIKRLAIVLLLAVLAVACAHKPKVSMVPATAPDKRAALEKIAEAYYRAATPATLESLVAEAQGIDPDAALYHEIAADLAQLQCDDDARFTHLLRALQNPDNDVALLHLHALDETALRDEHVALAADLLATLTTAHPDPRVRAAAHSQYRSYLRLRARFDDADAHLQQIAWRVPFAFIGSFSNEQNKGFDIEYPPESEIDLSQTYAGRNVRASWRTDITTGSFGEYDLREHLYPNTDSVAYAVSAVEASEAFTGELRVSTSDPIKIWVNGALIFEDRHINAWAFDLLTVPLTLQKGANRILIKTAQSDGTWDLMARITGAQGSPLPNIALTALSPDAPPAALAPTDTDPRNALDSLLDELPLSMDTVRGLFWAIQWAQKLELHVPAIEIADTMLQHERHSLRSLYEAALALWRNEERGRTSDIFDELIKRGGDKLLLFHLNRITFLKQNQLGRKARDAASALAKKHPENLDAQLALARAFSDEQWNEERCHIYQKLRDQIPDWSGAQVLWAGCLKDFAQHRASDKIYRRLLKKVPRHYRWMSAQYTEAIRVDDYAKARKILHKMLKAWPTATDLWSELGYLERIAGRYDEAEKAWHKQRDLSPNAPHPYFSLAAMAMFRQQTDKAVEWWRLALERDPANAALADRLAFLSPQTPKPWERDIPDEKALDAAVAVRNHAHFDSAADLAYLLDHQVTEVQPDGSALNVVTMVQHALNTTGRDALIEQGYHCWGNSRVLHAYAIDPQGRRIEAASIRDGVIRFRQLAVGSSTVVQYRCEEYPSGLIGDYYYTHWFFQGINRHFIESEFVLWLPNEMRINEFSRGRSMRAETKHGDQRRISWRAYDVPIVRHEPSMPSPLDLVWTLKVSTIPDWDMYARWEEALLKNVFRDNPELTALAPTVVNGAQSKAEILRNIQMLVQTEIRYQQDWEDAVAGHRPHTTRQILARRYGDCKDKAVLFIALAQKAGIEARFALVNTRGHGEVIREVPFPQFNHAIIYVPPQEGFATGRFYDPTVDSLDPETLRADNQGTLAFVLNLDQKSWEWVPIPYDDIQQYYHKQTSHIKVASDGTTTGTLAFLSQGHFAATLRQISRNRENFAKQLQNLIEQFIPGAVVGPPPQNPIDDLSVPVDFTVDFVADTFARRTENELRFRIPLDATYPKSFALEKREHDMMMGVPYQFDWSFVFALPANARLKSTPDNMDIDLPCLRYQRTFLPTKEGLEVTQTLISKCGNIAADEYIQYRAEAQRIRQATEEDVVLQITQP